MRDTYTFDDRADLPVTGAVVASYKPGLRHSIRPRRSVLERGEAKIIEKPAKPVARTLPARPKAPVERAPEASIDAPLSIYEERFAPRTDMPRWRDLATVEAGSRKSSRTAMPVVDAARDSTTVRAFDLLRTRLRQTTQERGWVNIAVTAPTSGCGNTFTAVNLALSLSRISGSRTVLMDMNLRSPGVAKAFDMTPRGSMKDFLSGRTPIGDHMVKLSDTLALGLSNTSDHHSAETIQATETARTLQQMRDALQPELVLYDMPAMLVHDDVSAFLPQLDGVLLVSDGTQTMGRDLMECERMLDGQVPLLGVVLNRARSNSIPRYA